MLQMAQIKAKEFGPLLIAQPCTRGRACSLPARAVRTGTFSSGPVQLQHPSDDGYRRQTAPVGRDKPCPFIAAE